ncbi:MAG: gluconokinase [Verrucomicrobia bacterium]|nr:gluconokinase [Verrucomicrobiota bacterium]
MGVAGSGKSTVAMHYAKGRGFAFVEADDFHPPANVAKMKSGQPLTDEDRVGWLSAMAQRIAEGKARGEVMVITCSALKRAYRDALRKGDPDLFFVLLDGPESLLAQRLAARTDHFMPPSLLASQLAILERPAPPSEKAVTLPITLPPAQLADILKLFFEKVSA